jgi:N-acetylglucosaminyl-diphospho-decaprenol L-rhamnosyltransferase
MEHESRNEIFDHCNESAGKGICAVRLAIVIVNYRTPELVIEALASLECEIDFDQDVALVVDNDSQDDSVDDITCAIKDRGWQKWTKVIRSPLNGGFSAGNNIGVRNAEADLYLLLNSDAYVRPGAIQKLRDYAAQEPAVGMFSPLLEWPDGEPQISCFRWHTPITELINAAGTGGITRLFWRHNVAMPVDPHPSYPEWTSFACVLIRRAVFEDLGLMDEGYFMYFDDVDYCRRAARKGWRVLNCPEARVVHLRGGTSPVKSSAAARKRLPAYYYHSRSRYYSKFYGLMGLWLANLLWSIGRLISAFRELIGHKQPHTAHAAWRDIWIGIGASARERSTDLEGCE